MHLNTQNHYTIMKELKIANARDTFIAIRNEIFSSGESRCEHELHGVLRVSEAMGCYNTGDILGEDPRTAERWG